MVGQGAAAAPCRRDSIKQDVNITHARSKRNEILREFGRKKRHEILQQHRSGLSPGDLKGKLHADTMAAIRAQLHFEPELDGGQLTEEDIAAILQDMEQQVLQEIQAELAELEYQEQQQAQQAACMAEQHLQYLEHMTPGEASGVLCPVCKASQLVLRQGLLVCPAEGWRLNLSTEGLCMDSVQQRLAAAYEEHAASGCTGQLLFAIQALFGADSLTASCTTCSYVGVVV